MRLAVLRCRLASASFPWRRVYVLVCEGVALDDDAVAAASRSLGLRAAVLRLREPPDPCAVAMSYMYALEDYETGEARARVPSLWALMYASLAGRVSDAIEANRGGANLAVASLSEEGLREALSALRLQPGDLGEPLEVSCDPSLLQRLAELRVSLLLK